MRFSCYSLILALCMAFSTSAQTPDVKISIPQTAFGLYNMSIEHMTGDTGLSLGVQYQLESFFEDESLKRIYSEDGVATLTLEYRDYYIPGRYYASGRYRGGYLRGRMQSDVVILGYIQGFKSVLTNWMVFELHGGAGVGIAEPITFDLNISVSFGLRF